MKTKLLLISSLLFSLSALAQTILPSTLNCSTILKKSGSPYIGNSTITLNSGCTLTVEEGVEIRMSYKSDIIIKGTANLQGTDLNPIHIHPKDTAWGNMFFDNGTGNLTHVIIESARPKHLVKNPSVPLDTGLQRAAISGYHANLVIKNCVFKKNLKSVYAKYGSVHIDHSEFDATNEQEKVNLVFVPNGKVENSWFSKTKGLEMYDMIDFEGVDKGYILNNYIEGGLDDGIDIGQGEGKGCNKITISGNYIENIQDNGISIGEGSWNIIVSNNIIANSGYGIAVKDYSHALIDHNILYRDSIGIGAYKKNLDGGGYAIVTNTIIANSILKASESQSGATLNISYSLSNTDVLPGINNITADPKILSIGYNNLKISSSSPCINKGDPTYERDPDGSVTDIGVISAATTVSTQEISKKDDLFQLFPNPANRSFYIKGESQVSGVYLIDMMGRIMEVRKSILGNNLYEIEFNDITRGVYFVKIQTSGNSFIKRIIIN